MLSRVLRPSKDCTQKQEDSYGRCNHNSGVAVA
jgi:hypothetical protein